MAASMRALRSCQLSLHPFTSRFMPLSQAFGDSIAMSPADTPPSRRRSGLVGSLTGSSPRRGRPEVPSGLGSGTFRPGNRPTRRGTGKATLENASRHLMRSHPWSWICLLDTLRFWHLRHALGTDPDRRSEIRPIQSRIRTTAGFRRGLGNGGPSRSHGALTAQHLFVFRLELRHALTILDKRQHGAEGR